MFTEIPEYSRFSTFVATLSEKPKFPSNTVKAYHSYNSLLLLNKAQYHCNISVIVSAYRYIAITNMPIIPAFVEYLGHFLIDFNQIYRHSSVPKNTSP